MSASTNQPFNLIKKFLKIAFAFQVFPMVKTEKIIIKQVKPNVCKPNGCNRQQQTILAKKW